MQPEQKPRLPSVGVMSVATNLYLNYWKSMVLSADRVSLAEDQITFIVFTENPEEATSFGSQLLNVKVRAYKIDAYSWPEATLLRYEIFLKQVNQIDCDILMHLDADMLFAANPWNRIKNNLREQAVCLVRHPGFWRPKKSMRASLYLKNPAIAYRDFRMKISQGGIGAWETNQRSSAFVKRKMRSNYFCGGTWFGLRDSVVHLLENLSTNVQLDNEKSVIAIWHDESHLNKWATENLFSTESPELCFDETYPQLVQLKPYIIAVRKLEKTRE